MKTIKKTLDETAKKLISKMVAQDKDGWPPLCTSFVYQPERPNKADAETEVKA